MARGPRNNWTLQEDNRLAAIWNKHRTADVASMMGRSYESVKARAKYLGLPNRLGTGRLPPRWVRVRENSGVTLGALEWAPGQFAVDAQSYRLITGREPT